MQPSRWKKKVRRWTLRDKTKKIGIYCRSGKRAGRAVTKLRSRGYKNVVNLGGFSEALERQCTCNDAFGKKQSKKTKKRSKKTTKTTKKKTTKKKDHQAGQEDGLMLHTLRLKKSPQVLKTVSNF